MGNISASIRDFCDISSSDGRKFLTRYDLDHLAVDDLVNDALNQEVYAGFAEEFSVDLSLLDLLLSSEMVTMKDLLHIKKENPEVSPEQILVELYCIILVDEDEVDDDDMYYEYGDDIISHSTVASILDSDEFSPIRIEFYTHELFGVQPGESITYPMENSVLCEILKSSVPNVSRAVLTVSFQGDGPSIQGNVEICREHGMITVDHAALATLVECEGAGSAEGAFLIRGITDEVVETVTECECGSHETFRSFLVGWYRSGDTLHGLTASMMSDAVNTDAVTGEMMVPVEGVEYLDALTLTPWG